MAQQQQFPKGIRFPPPPMWTPTHTQQHMALPKVKLLPVLAQGPQLLVHSGRVNLQQARRGRLEAAL